MLCMDGAAACGDWLDYLRGSDENDLSGTDQAILERLFEATRLQLDEFDFSFDLLLPEDEAALIERAAALSAWCEGFLLGLGYGSKDAEWPGECTEILRDLVEISALDPEASGEADEEAYSELAEYVRVGAQVIRSELQTQTPGRVH